jgi:hypothetical protein
MLSSLCRNHLSILVRSWIRTGFEAYWQPEDLHNALTVPTDRRLFAIAHAMLNLNRRRSVGTVSALWRSSGCQ